MAETSASPLQLSLQSLVAVTGTLLACSTAPAPSASHDAQASSGVTANHKKKEPISADELARYDKECTTEQASILCMDLGERYHRGDGVARDAKRATLYFSLACEKALVSFACPEFSEVLLEESTPDFDRVFAVHKIACEGHPGDAVAGQISDCLRFGDMWRDGQRAPKNAQRARELYKLGCGFHQDAKKTCDETKAEEDCDPDRIGSDEVCKRPM
jgi:TPR repeat protein